MKDCKFTKGCLLHAILVNPEECKQESIQEGCWAFERFTCMPHRYMLAKEGLKALKLEEMK